GGAQFGPVGDTVQVDGDPLAGQGAEAVPVPAPLLVGLTGDDQLPVFQVDAGGWSRRQDREVLDQVLTWRQLGARAPASLEPARHRAHRSSPPGLAEGEGVGLDAGVEEGDLEAAVADGAGLAEELVQPW